MDVTEIRIKVNFSTFQYESGECDACTTIHNSYVVHFVQGQIAKLQVWRVEIGAYQRYKQSTPRAFFDAVVFWF